ncbi:hypothetical protein [Thermoflavifilum thermophilum]|uniref:CCDC81-like prokaryotic HU domain-containing protein n=1 Tax=Thermoflavifilum thermophilum TaxID=1393122 RepID=A0A1I7NJB0_9BACT|nr:hypothetical protein [Thermoflavifilum thermophilum]SFV34699.1 hypothetical protein SAMN05660895_2068 [Thermoflavifilum thermophilum]
MKIDHLITQYLFLHKQAYLPSVGLFILQDAEDPQGTPVIHFQSLSKGNFDGLVDFIVERTGKMRVVAIADVQCFCYEIKEMLNIHQPFTIQGIGTLWKTLDGTIHFKQEDIQLDKKKHTNRTQIADISLQIQMKHDAPPVKWGNTYAFNYHRLWLAGIFVLLISGIIILANSHARLQMSDPEPASRLIESSLSPVTLDNNAESDARQSADPSDQKVSYLVIFEISDSTRAHKRYEQLTSWGDQIVIFKWDNRHYALASPFTTLPADTAHAKDSIQVLFGRPVFIQYLSSSVSKSSENNTAWNE